MPYATLESLTRQFGEEAVRKAADRDRNGVIDPDVIDQALVLADGVIDSRIGVKYVLPLNSVPAVLVQYAGDIAFYLLSPHIDTYVDEKRRRYEDALKWLDAIAKGSAVLDGQEAPATKAATGIYVSAGAHEYTRDTLRGIL